MKKISLTGFALLAFAAASFAQSPTNSATLQQNGNNQTALQIQTGNNLKSTISQDRKEGVNGGNFAATAQTSTGAAGNEATVTQNLTSNSNRGYVTQLGGVGNKGSITQSNNSGGLGAVVTPLSSPEDVKALGGNWAGIWQQGNNNMSTEIIQNDVSKGNFAEIFQFGSGNLSTGINQSIYSSNNTAKINQGQLGSGVSGNKAGIAQQGTSQENKATIVQRTNNNDATIIQNDFSLRNEASISQIGGTGSKAKVEQRYTSYDNKAVVSQTASNNQATVNQTSNSSNNLADVSQSGESNQATIGQSNTSQYNKAYVVQPGYYNEATVKQNYNSSFNYASIKQSGQDAQAYIEQETNSSNNQARVEQNGYDNWTKVTQSNSASGNTAQVKQDLLTTAGYGNIAEVSQSGTNHKAYVTQNFSMNTAKIRQENTEGAGNNYAQLDQWGNKNIIQGVDGAPFALQRGSNNTLSVTQNSGSSAPYAPNVANVSQIGNGNMATIMQTGMN